MHVIIVYEFIYVGFVYYAHLSVSAQNVIKRSLRTYWSIAFDRSSLRKYLICKQNIGIINAVR